jgi:hypothetical protein
MRTGYSLSNPFIDHLPHSAMKYTACALRREGEHRCTAFTVTEAGALSDALPHVTRYASTPIKDKSIQPGKQYLCTGHKRPGYSSMS